MAGQPPYYASPEDMQRAIDVYFELYPSNPTMSGLALSLGFADRQSLYDYEKREQFSCTIKSALSRIEDIHEQNLYNQGCTGSIFWLKNRGWRDKTETEHSGTLSHEATVTIVNKPNAS